MHVCVYVCMYHIEGAPLQNLADILITNKKAANITDLILFIMLSLYDNNF